MDRAFASGAKGRGFESRREHKGVFMKYLKKINLICLIIILFFPFLLLEPNKVLAKEGETSNKDNYYYESDDIIKRRLEGLDNNSLNQLFFEYNHKYYFSKLANEEQNTYNELLTNLKAFNFNDLLVKSIGDKKYITITSLSELNNNIIKALLYDHAGLIYLSLNYQISEDKKNLNLELTPGFENSENFKKNISSYLSGVLNIKEAALKEPHSYKRGFVAFDLLLTKSKERIAKYSAFYALITTNTLYIRTLKQIFDQAYLKGLFISQASDNEYLYMQMKSIYFPINIVKYLNEKNNKYIYDFYLNFVASPSTDIKLLDIKELNTESFKKFYKFWEVDFRLDNISNKYTNRVFAGDNPNPSFYKLNTGFLSQAAYDEYKMPITNIVIKNKSANNYDITYFYNNTYSKIAPTDKDFSGLVLMMIKSLDSDTCIDSIIAYKVKKRFIVNIINSIDPINKPTLTDNVFEGDYFKTPPKRDVDGNVFKQYDNQAAFTKPVVSDLNIREEYRLPKLLFKNGKGAVVEKGLIENFDSESLLRRVKPDTSSGNIFVGFKIIGLNNGKTLSKELKDKYIGKEPKKGEVIINDDYVLEEVIEEIILEMKGSFFKKIKKVKTNEGEPPTFRVHPFFTVPSLNTIYFKNNALYPKSFELINTDIINLRQNEVKEYDMKIRAKGRHSYDEVDLAVHIIIDKDIFLTKGWLKHYWWTLVISLAAIIALPIVIKILIKIFKRSKE